jgi:alpha-D-xyloside xylohydrolase
MYTKKVNHLKQFALTAVLTCCYVFTYGQQVPKPLAFEPYNQSNYSEGNNLNGLNGGYGWTDAWHGDAPKIVVQNKGEIALEGLTNDNSVKLTSIATEQVLNRSLSKKIDGSKPTIWVSFSIIKQKNNARMGVALINGKQEALFIGTNGANDRLLAGDQAINSLSTLVGHRLFVRIDFKAQEDIAYIFVDPGENSDPDIEGASVMLHGHFKFDGIALSINGQPVQKESTGYIGPIRIGDHFQDVVMTKAQTDSKFTQVNASYKITGWKKQADALAIKTDNGLLKITPYLNKVFHVQFGPDTSVNKAISYAVSIKPAHITFDVNETSEDIVLHTADYDIKVAKANARIRLFNSSGKCLFQESSQIQRFVTKPQGELVPALNFSLTKQEALYGLGQFRDGALNLRSKKRELVQVNTQIAMPVILSTNNWALFWDNPARTIFEDSDQGMHLTSDFGDCVSYFVFTGSSLDELIDGYRRLTGQAPMLPKWALGYHQSRNKYATQDELLSVAERMRREHIPFSSIFIDYYYWGKYGTGSHHFDEAQFPDLPAMMNTLHNDLHAKVVATVWPAFKPGSQNYQDMERNGYLLKDVKALDGIVYDAFNPKAAALYWQQVASQLIPTKIDGWFLDGPEPDNATSFLKANTYLGPAVKIRNLFPLFHSTNFYRGLMQLDSTKRPYIITRSAWASQQKNGTVIWSGDIASTFDELKKQIPAGLDFTASGIPYWTTDIGGYSGGNPADPAYQEVFVRWWQYGAFCPVFRSHGRRYPGDTKGPNELWAFGQQAQRICTSYDELRYRLLPYIYSLTGKVTLASYTPMRLLAFDFSADSLVYNINDEFMYGPSFLVSPVTSAGAESRSVYLPGTTKWTDFWSGKIYTGGQSIIADAPLDKIPLFVRCGAIVPMGPVQQYTDEVKPDMLELRIYPGANGKFDIYEDDGNSTRYKKGKYSIISLTWNDKDHTLTIGKRTGDFEGMLVKRKFKIVVVGTNDGIGMETPKGIKTVTYNGDRLTVKYTSN